MFCVNEINEVNVVGGDGDDRDRPSTRPDGQGSDWRPPYSGIIISKQVFYQNVFHVRAHGANQFHSILSLSQQCNETMH